MYENEAPALTREEVEVKRKALKSLVPRSSSDQSSSDQSASGLSPSDLSALEQSSSNQFLADHPLRLHVLASGSKGNASAIEVSSTGQFFVIDCGISCKRFLQALSDCHLSLENLMGIVVTHEHTDHTKGLPVLCKTLTKQGREVALYVNDQVRQNSKEICSLADNDDISVDIQHFDEHSQLSFASMQIYPFATSHDAASSFGFRVEYDNDALGFVTDTGILNDEMMEALRDVRILGLESNHDASLLKQGPYPFVVKQRIASDRGHLSNAQASDALDQLLSPRLESVVALHISESNNTYRLPAETLHNVLVRNAHPGQAFCGFQNRSVSL